MKLMERVNDIEVGIVEKYLRDEEWKSQDVDTRITKVMEELSLLSDRAFTHDDFIVVKGIISFAGRGKLDNVINSFIVLSCLEISGITKGSTMN